MRIAELNVRFIKAAPVVPQSVPVTVSTPPTIPDIPLSSVAVALPVDDPEIPQPIPAEYGVTTTVSVLVHIPPRTLP